jgi:hypothetical protein
VVIRDHDPDRLRCRARFFALSHCDQRVAPAVIADESSPVFSSCPDPPSCDRPGADTHPVRLLADCPGLIPSLLVFEEVMPPRYEPTDVPTAAQFRLEVAQNYARG